MKYLKRFENVYSPIENETEGKDIVYIDMDDTICDYMSHHNKMSKLNPDIKYPQSQKGFFLNLEPIEGAIDAINQLRKKYDVYILTRPSYLNPHCYTEKRLWIEKYFGVDFCKKLIISPNKDLLMGDYLIDDMPWPGFKGKQLQFGKPPYENWEKILEFFE
jgi:5'(3')-deoxyribonucleotidase